MSITIGSLFSGIGGLDLAVEAATGGRVAWQCESNPYARRVLEKHWPGVPIFNDIKALHRPPVVDALCGGFPCQDISIAGKRKGIKDGKQSGLWREFARIIREILPRFVFLENVSAITRRGLDVVLGDLAASGFNAEWGCLRACDVGAPHIRNRWFCFGWLADANAPGLLSEQAAGKIGHYAHGGHPWPPGRAGEWPRNVPEPGIRRGANGSADIVDRLRCLGNAVVPQQGAEAFRQLIERSGQ